ncbi:Germin-like protein 1 [Melia azedarach]|uniref:Germin-like protein 1 n=1 Tax=Melia azedarach TaxID=155640 RepID=A0ACC1YCS8_MELAZ|nr:Germin-like protein 1 [Melia azedarach]
MGSSARTPRKPKQKTSSIQGLTSLDTRQIQLGSNVTTVNVEQIPGLNTLGISAVRIDYAPYGQNPPHIHPRATEILTVLEGTLYVGFVTSNQLNNTLIAKVLKKGDVFVFPVGLIHFQFNIGKTNAVAIAALSSQNPGCHYDSELGPSERNHPSVLIFCQSIPTGCNAVKSLQAKFWSNN